MRQTLINMVAFGTIGFVCTELGAYINTGHFWVIMGACVVIQINNGVRT